MFRHSRLTGPRSIRLLRLVPATNFDLSLEVELLEASLDTDLLRDHRYEALSYVWGARSSTRPITCNGDLLLVTPSCESALRHLREQDNVRTLWVDAICIDQEDTQQGLQERNSQIPLMGEIYAKAVRTLCWLGEGNDFTRDVFQHLKKIGACPSQRGLSKLMYYEETLRRKKELGDESSCLDHIFCHPWHSRLWTVQEVAFSEHCQIVCGKSSISWDAYSAASKFLIYEQFIEFLDLQAAKTVVSIDMRNVLRDYLLHRRARDLNVKEEDAVDEQAQQVVFLTSCLTDVNQLQATDPKDKIYGLYAIYTSLGIPLPAVNYGKPVARVYTDAAIGMIAWSKSLKVLGDACSINRDSTLPSWVPDWNDAEVRMFMPVSNATEGSCVANTAPDILSPTAGKLCIRGKKVGSVTLQRGIATMSFPTHSGLGDPPILTDTDCQGIGDVQFLRLLINKIKFFRDLLIVLHENRHLCCGEDPTDIFNEITTLGNASLQDDMLETWIDILRYPDGQCDLSTGYALAEIWRAADIVNASNWTSELIQCTTIAASLLSNSIRAHGTILSTHSAILDLMKEISQNLADQTVVSVQHDFVDYVTLATTFQSVTARDLIVLLEGADWPVTLRPSGNEWRFIGPAFVIGMMDGEAWSGGNGDLGNLTYFTLG